VHEEIVITAKTLQLFRKFGMDLSKLHHSGKKVKVFGANVHRQPRPEQVKRVESRPAIYAPEFL